MWDDVLPCVIVYCPLLWVHASCETMGRAKLSNSNNAITLCSSAVCFTILVLDTISHWAGLILQMLFDQISKCLAPLLNQVRMLQPNHTLGTIASQGPETPGLFICKTYKHENKLCSHTLSPKL